MTRSLAVACLVLSSTVCAQSLSHAPDPLFHDGMEGVSAGPFNDSDAARFLTQATFGPTDADIAHLRAIGYQAWLNEQYAAAPTSEGTYLKWVGNTLAEDVGQDNRKEAWFLAALGGPDPQYPSTPSKNHTDQLRQRVAFALSEILVISQESAGLYDWSEGMAYYYDILAKDAFANYRALLGEVTLNPAMGVYLNMMGNRRADLSQNLHPDENYAREINQLFSIGLVMLNLDGTPQLSGGQPIPTYTQSTITNFAHALTGWSWASCDKNYDFPQNAPPVFNGTYSDNFTWCYPPWYVPSDYLTPMVAYDKKDFPNSGDPSYHDDGTSVATGDISHKQLLQYPGAVAGGVLPDGGTAASDLQFALDNIYNHPNVAPFICKQLIQRLVTSNPSPAYVKRIATLFNTYRTNPAQLKVVVQAILLDPEARYGQWQNPDTFGKLREPLLTVTHYWRAMHAQHHCGQDVPASGNSAATHYANQPYRYAGWGSAWSVADTQYGGGVAQAPLDAFTVFNFFKPSYMPPGETTARSLVAPEFQLQTDSIIANSSNSALGRTFWYDAGDTCDSGDTFGNVMVDFTQDLALAGSGTGGPSDALVDAYNMRFMSGQMSPFMRKTLIDHLNTVDANSWDSTWKVQRIKRALYLILTSPEYMVQK